MAVKMRVRITGADELARKLNILGEEAKKIVEPAGKDGADVIARAAKEKAPEKSGDLKNSISTKPKEIVPLKATFEIGSDIFYAPFVEHGHPLVRNKKTVGSVRPHPFLRPALDENKEEIKKVFADEVRRRLKL